MTATAVRAVIFDLDGTLLDSDRALVNAFLRFGVPEQDITFGHVLHHECERLGIDVQAYIDAYDPADVQPYEGVAELLEAVPRWAVASHKDRTTGRAELAALGWQPDCAFFTQDFGGTKDLGVVLDALELAYGEVVFVGDTAHDRSAAHAARVPFIAAAWNPRCDVADGDLVATKPGDVLRLAGLR